MKKIKAALCSIPMFLLLLLLWGCGEDTDTITKEHSDLEKPMLDYYPTSIGSTWQYEDVEGNTLTRNIKGTVKVEGLTYKIWHVEPSDPEDDPQLFRWTKSGIRLYSKDVNQSLAKQILQDLGWAVPNLKIQTTIKEWLLVSFPLERGDPWLVMHILTSGRLLGQWPFTMTIKITCQTAKKEILTVPAGTFECIKLIYWYNAKLEIKNEVPSSNTEKLFTYWLAPDVGIVQIENIAQQFQLVNYELALGL